MLAESGSGTKTGRGARRDLVLEDGRAVLIRPASSGDADSLRAMFARLSPETIYRRFHSPFPRVPEWAVARFLEGGEVLVAVAGEEMVGHAMGVRSADGREAEIAVLVEDAWQSAGVGKLLLSGLAAEARKRGVEVLTCEALGENLRVLDLVNSLFSEVGYAVAGGARLIRARSASLRTGLVPERGDG
jgi:GNAT superfamily N-acetyltransferase